MPERFSVGEKMNNPLTPVEAISRRIEMEKRLGGGPVIIAALELAKAMCEVPPHLLNLKARLKLAELLKALQR